MLWKIKVVDDILPEVGFIPSLLAVGVNLRHTL